MCILFCVFLFKVKHFQIMISIILLLYTYKLTKKLLCCHKYSPMLCFSFASYLSSYSNRNILDSNFLETFSHPFRKKQFDTTIAFEVLEHIPNPAQTLKEISRCTNDLLIFSVPNCDTNNHLRKYDLAMAHWTDPTHCNFFTKKSLTSFLSSNGYELIELIDCYEISPNRYYWDTLKIPKVIGYLMKTIIDTPLDPFFSWSEMLFVTLKGN